MTDKLHIIEPATKLSHTVIFLHGRDSTGPEFAAELLESQASDERSLAEIFPSFKWVFPSAGLRHSERFGTSLSQWFDMSSVENSSQGEDLQIAGLGESIGCIIEVIKHEAAKTSPERIILAGISQGCVTATYALLLGNLKVGALLGFSGWLPFQRDVERIAKAGPTLASRLRGIHNLPFAASLPAGDTDEPTRPPVFLSHCEDDEVVAKQHGDLLFYTLTAIGLPVERHTYLEGGHWFNEPQGIDDMVEFLNRVMFGR